MKNQICLLNTLYTKYRTSHTLLTRYHLLKKIKQEESNLKTLPFSDMDFYFLNSILEKEHLFNQIRLLYVLSFSVKSNKKLEVFFFQKFQNYIYSDCPYDLSFFFSTFQNKKIPNLENFLLQINQKIFLQKYQREMLLLLGTIATKKESLIFFSHNLTRYKREALWGIGNLASPKGDILLKRSFFNDILKYMLRILNPKKERINIVIYYSIAQICFSFPGINPNLLNELNKKLFSISSKHPLKEICMKRINNISLSKDEELVLIKISQNFNFLDKKF